MGLAGWMAHAVAALLLLLLLGGASAQAAQQAGFGASVTPPLSTPAKAECAPVMIDASDKGFDDAYCHGPIGTLCYYNCSEGYTDEGTGSVVCQPNRKFSTTKGCTSSVATAGAMMATAATAMVVTAVGVTAGAAVASSVAAGSAGGAAGGSGVAGDPVSLIFSVQFVAVSGSIAAPVGPAFREFASSFGWANGEMAPPGLMTTEAEPNVTSSHGDHRRLAAIACVGGDNACEDKKAEEEEKIRQKELKKAGGGTPQDLFIGNMIALALVLVVGWLAHLAFFHLIGALMDRRRNQVVELKAAVGDSLSEGLSVDVPEKWVVPPPLYFLKIAIILICVAYMGISKSTTAAMCSESTDWYFFTLALLVFLLIPVGFPVYVFLVVRSITGRGTSCGIETALSTNKDVGINGVTLSLPQPKGSKDSDVSAVVFHTHLPRLREAKKRAKARGQEYDEAKVKQLIELIKEGLTPAQIADVGFWEGTTPEGCKQLAIYTPVFAKANDISADMTPLFQSLKLLTVMSLSILAPGCLAIIGPLAQLFLLCLLLLVQIAFIVYHRPFLIRERDYIEVGVSNFLLCAMFASISVHTAETASLETMHVLPRRA
jgi:hypothetical protein